MIDISKLEAALYEMCALYHTEQVMHKAGYDTGVVSFVLLSKREEIIALFVELINRIVALESDARNVLV